jgi:fructosamine-3-kinase
MHPTPARQRSVLLHGDLHVGNLPLDGNERLVAIDPNPAIGDPEQDIGDAAAKNDWGQKIATRVKQLAGNCNVDTTPVSSHIGW